ncbi:cytochrome d ubiquinol oxidase subunit II [Ancrocorticia populi]|uniref:Cytochrome d ubiquinol oxidase subunit II n=1 Tax=Ancrocorticia populi TaxID=2175228 RepID=A0A2V1KEJ5_9ACTO|nr:cytochrome d ubiquinol oxidase subunit II [Ancrocorticia populi]PWF27709.1 cytochrome d ubiquinol oxidase subunit II [Ancrocorticia populi]
MDLSFIQLLWFILIGVLWMGYIALEGFGFGVGILLKGLARNEKERRASLNAIGPHWDGNEVWLITAGGATFAAFPEWYATMFSGMYLALVVILVCLIFRICALEWRKMINSPRWRNTWDWINATVCFVVSILWGVAFSNFVQGMKIEVGHYEDGVFQAVPADQVNTSLDAVDKHFLTGGFFSLLTPFTILGGVMMLALFISHGALFISIKTATGDFHNRAQALAKKSMGVAIILVVVWALWAQLSYTNNAISWLPLGLTAVAFVAAWIFIQNGSEVKAFVAHFVGLALAVVFIWFTIFPDAMKSSIDPAYSLTLAQASATAPTQTIMTIAAVVFVPIILGYTIWAYKVFARRINVDDIPEEASGIDYKQIRTFDNV